ncbi:TrpB-like pyridoxal phosphate-dependent enzyme [Brooklawnia propionicigenes]|jgi:tryptophan synthase beta chain|uniref:tryptophan synthase n=1 Tax=Brooklawnia propionicigenes TaxID=3041175 RepID=A0AAN0MHY3_9ACTN|nr:TrpB-like pyridoxal phosphate-dependent enzyme [Brooklawnia sp. SH051]MEA5122174.1 TrpB-like pyridoxal phosphate-dependent enzyme [Propionibacterium sp.]BEH02984.1 TrpB-like pyridoxal phosphate-dependent enzyme [Brooklawnia sp. SH051]
MTDERTKFLLPEDQMPTHWYNLTPDLPTPPPPPLNPATKQPAGPADLAAIFPEALIAQEVSTERWIPIPDAVAEIYRLWRPSPLYRAHRFEQALGTKARVYYKYEGASPVGSHKTNSAVAQAFYNKQAGIKRLCTETGAGQWGAALSFACQVFGLTCDVWQVRNSYETKPYRRIQMETFGAHVTPSPSDRTEIGRQLRERFPDTTGSLGMAISEAIEEAAKDPHANYSLGSVLNHVALHQTIIGLETLAQLELAGERLPDHLFACAGGGSNLAGLSFPFLHENLTAGASVHVRACEPAAAPSLTQGEYRYDFGDTGGFTPLLKMYTLGADFVPASVHAGGLRYHGMSPLVSAAYDQKLLDAVAIKQRDAFAAGVLFARAEGIIPASESNHAIAGAVAHLRAADNDADGQVVLIGLSGNGQLDLPAYADYLSGTMIDA